MPLVSLISNVAPEKLKDKKMRSDFYAVLSQTLGVPKEVISLHLASDPGYSWGDSDEPGAVTILKIVQNTKKDDIVRHCKRVEDFVATRLGVPRHRSFVAVQKFGAAEVRFNDMTIEEFIALHPHLAQNNVQKN